MFKVTKSTYVSLLNRVAEKLMKAESRRSSKQIVRWAKVESWLLKRLAAVKPYAKIDRSKHISDRVTHVGPNHWAGQLVKHATGLKGVVKSDEAPAGRVLVLVGDGLELWKTSEVRDCRAF